MNEQDGESMQTNSESPGAKLRRTLSQNQITVAPGAYEPVQARVIERVGFPAIYAGGSGISCAVYGRPDMGISTMTEIRDVSSNIARSVSIPVLGDIDQGFGDLINVRRSVQEFERGGLAGVHIEDEAGASKHAHGSVPIPVELMCDKIRVACDARRDPDFMIFGRCDSLRTLGMKETLERSRAYVDSGADGLWVFTGLDPEPRELEEISAAFPDVPLIYDWTVRGIEAQTPLKQIEEMGYRMVIVPNLMLFGMIAEASRLLTEMKDKGSIAHLLERIASVELVDEVVGLNEARAFQSSFGAPTYVKPGQTRWVMGGHDNATK
jgi:2-methylisocitrate lyase-like PEP mutase family enzyme